MLKIEATKIIEVMDKLDDLPYQKILFDGTWGVGKTKHIIESIENKNNIHYISLFGKRDINALYQELYYLLLSKHEVKFKKILNHMGKINLSKFGFNISIPLISDIFKDIHKRLKTKSNITIIIDDLERKSNDFDLKEIFGFIDSITKPNKEIKIVLVASSDNFSDTTKKTFKEYAEKSIDRIYKITTYSGDAPQKIMGDTIWPKISEIYLDNEFRNLRTLEKTDLFIKEVIYEIDHFDVFTDRFNKEDIYKICFSVVLFVVEHKSEMKLLPKNDEGNLDTFYEAYNSEDNIPNYIWHYILKKNLNNSMMQNFTPIILEWFLTGDFSKDQFKEIAKQVNTYVETRTQLLTPLFMSDEQIKKEIEDFSSFIENVDETIPMNGYLQRLDELADISEKLNFDFKYTIDEVVDWIMNNKGFNNYDDNYFDAFIKRESSFVNKVISTLQITVKNHERDRLLSEMVVNTQKQNFTQNEIDKIAEFKRFIARLKNDENEDINKVIITMKSNKWFLPLPLGEISHSHWTYCHEVFKCIVDMGSWGEERTLIEGAGQYFKQEINNYSDKVFKYRLEHLIKQYF
ncbi:ATP-binding protein [Oceanobacillus jordanicus]|uniref:ATP-binding protein n=1 Tax=Oceanobacillus jordanicus TaxID=2867266 RepID=A0AAW5B793_9BACI|nr:ATP-binding protein [Oceanobacillus jordanicus]MCG3420399.1 ATP-binding protein [Oceanobacillus jordanicus]